MAELVRLLVDKTCNLSEYYSEGDWYKREWLTPEITEVVAIFSVNWEKKLFTFCNLSEYYKHLNNIKFSKLVSVQNLDNFYLAGPRLIFHRIYR